MKTLRKTQGKVGTGKCESCKQTRVLFAHSQHRTGTVYHDECSDCFGHDYAEATVRHLCSYCHQNTPTEIDEDGDDW